MHVGVYLHMIIFHDICCAFEEPHTTVNVVFPYWFATESIELSCHHLAVRVHAFQQGVLVNELRSRQSDRNHTDVMMSFAIELSDEFLFPRC